MPKAQAQATTPSRSTAVYVWLLPNDRPSPAVLGKFFRENGVSEADLAEPLGAVSATEKNYIADLKKAMGPGATVYDLIGAGCDAVTSENGVNTISDIIKDKAKSGVFDGYDIDVEPWSCHVTNASSPLLWNDPTSQARLIANYETSLSNAFAQRAGKPMIVSIQYWLNTVKDPVNGGSVTDQVLKRSTGISIMAYYDKYASIMNAATSELGMARSQNETARIAVTTEPVTPGVLTSANTFATRGSKALDRVLDRLQQIPCAQTCASDTYAGPMVEDYSNWATLAK